MRWLEGIADSEVMRLTARGDGEGQASLGLQSQGVAGVRHD